MTDKAKKRVRKVQDLTGWKYQFCTFLCRALGQDAVLATLAEERPEGDASLADVARALNERAKSANRNRKKCEVSP